MPKRLRVASLLLCFLLIWPVSVPAGDVPAPGKNRVENNQNIYRSVKPDKSLLTSPQFLVLDDFNTGGALISRRGTQWQIKSPVPGALDLSLEKEDARNPINGYSLKVNFHLMPRETASFKCLLNRLDVSQAEYLVFKYRLKINRGKNFSGRLYLALSDGQNKTIIQDITQRCPFKGEGWNEAILPISLFKTLDLDYLHTMEFRLVAGKEEVGGVLGVDEIAFFGYNDIGFESNRDNLIGFPKTVIDAGRKSQLAGIKKDKKFLREIAYDTWKYFVNARDRKSDLIIDHIRLGDLPLAADYTSPTNIAMDLLATVAAYDLEFIPKNEAIKKIEQIFATLRALRKYDGFFYNFYDTKQLQITREYISSVDNGWLAIALVVVRQAFHKELYKPASEFLDGCSFNEFLDTENNQFVVGFDVPKKDFGKYHYGMLVTEARATSFYAIGKGNVPKTHWWFLFRTLPKVWKWQTQVPQGKEVARDGIEYFQGYYEHDKKKFVPSWGGSLFEFLMPTLVINEKKLAPKGLGRNDIIATEMQRDYALKEKKYPIWGISPASSVNGRRWEYLELGTKALGAKGYPDRGVVTPHVSFLALETLSEDAIANIRKMICDYDAYGEYGFYDSINVKNKTVNTQYLALDQGMILVAICNYLKKGSIQKYFHADDVAKSAQDLLKEDFFNP